MRKEIALFLAFGLLTTSAAGQIELRSADDVLKIAAANDIERSLERMRAQESVKLAKKNITGFLPVLDFSLTDAARAQKDSDDSKNKAIEFGLTQKIFNGGKTLFDWKMQKEKNFYQFLAVKKNEERFENELLQCYYNALLAKLKSHVLQKNCENAELVLTAARLEAEQGMSTQTDWLETLLKYRQMELEAKAAKDDFCNKESELKRKMSIAREQTIVFCEAESFEDAMYSCALIDGLRRKRPEYSQSAVQNSLDLKMALAELNWSQKARAMQKRFFLPSVSVRGGVSFSGRNYPLTNPTYSLKVIFNFEDNPWISGSMSKQSNIRGGKLNAMTDSISAQGTFYTTWFGQMKINKIEIAQKKAGVENTKKQIEDNIFEIIQKIENAQESFILNCDSVKIKEQKLLLSKLSLEQGWIKKSDYLDEMIECAKQKINCLLLLKERDYLTKELEAAVSIKILKEEK